MKPCALIYVQHLLGTGHLVRSAALARGLAHAGWDVQVASGGRPAPHISFGASVLHQLPPIHAADTSFKLLHDARRRPVDDALRHARTGMLLDLFVGARPDAVVVETYPFGRRQMEFELLPLLKTAKRSKHKPVVACSVRDILQMAKNRARLEASASIVAAYFDRVLVHGDPRFVAFDETFPLAPRIADKIVYTGYVANDNAKHDPATARGDDVIVSAGGGPVGLQLLQTALAARPLSAGKRGVWRLLAASDLAPKLPALRRKAPPNVSIEKVRADFPALLRAARVSVSQAGYNTVMDIL
ncbi:MAG: glycosyltransferase family protein, partial [Alphaproteobacteria bacterium]